MSAVIQCHINLFATRTDLNIYIAKGHYHILSTKTHSAVKNYFEWPVTFIPL